MNRLIDKISAIIVAAVILTIGILCIVANSAEDATAFEGISVTLGVVFIIVASLALILEIGLICLAKGGILLKGSAIASGVLLAAGIFFVTNKTAAGTMLYYFLEFVPFVLIVLGALLALDAILTLVFALVSKSEVKAAVIVFVIKLVLAALAILFGALALGDNAIGNNKFMIFGIILIVYAVFSVIAVLFMPRFAFIAVSATREDVKKEEE